MHLNRREFLSLIAGGILAHNLKASPGLKARPHPGKVVSVHNRSKSILSKEALASMLDRGLTELTGTSDPKEAWLSLFSSRDRISIKVNCLGGRMMSSNPLIALAITDRLKKCGVKPANIIIWDRSTRELKETGFPVNIGGSDIQCFGTDELGFSGTLYEKGSVGSLFSRILTDYTGKLINIPVLKDHGICGLTFAMKNHFGSINNPNKYHLNRCNPYIPDLNSMDIIRKKEILIAGDATLIQVDGGPAYKKQWAIRYNALLIGDDPVAVDTIGLRIIEAERKRLGRESLASKGLYPDYIETAENNGLGVSKDAKQIKVFV